MGQTYDAGDKEQVRAAKGKAAMAARSRREDMALVLSTPGGRRIIWALLGSLRVFALSFVEGKPDLTAFHEGARQVGNPLLAELMNQHAAAYAQMAAEAQPQAQDDDDDG